MVHVQFVALVGDGEMNVTGSEHFCDAVRRAMGQLDGEDVAQRAVMVGLSDDGGFGK